MVRFKNGKINLSATIRAAFDAVMAANSDFEMCHMSDIRRELERMGFTIHGKGTRLNGGGKWCPDCIHLKERPETLLHIVQIRKVAAQLFKHDNSGFYWL